jgi:anthranilate synthase component II
MKVVIIDNRDSFTYNLSELVSKIMKKKPSIRSINNFSLDEIARFDKIIFSPGPDLPEKNDTMWQILNKYKSSKSILGICLGMQAIAIYFGGDLINLKNVQHGKICDVNVFDEEEILFSKTGLEFTAGLYHSWAVSDSLPKDLIPTSFSDKNILMSFTHKKYDIKGLQFHPESYMTPLGQKILENWLKN